MSCSRFLLCFDIFTELYFFFAYSMATFCEAVQFNELSIMKSWNLFDGMESFAIDADHQMSQQLPYWDCGSALSSSVIVGCIP